MKRLLIVEDNKELQELLKERFSREEFELHQAFSAEEAIAEIEKNPPDMVLLDILLPGKLSGMNVLDYLQSRQRFNDVQVAIFSNLDNPDKMTFSLQNVDYMLKSNTSIDDVVAVVKMHLNKAPQS